MLDLLAAGEGRAPRALGTVSVDHGAEAALGAWPQAASSCSWLSVGVPPTLMLADAKILITSAPADASSSTRARISSGPPLPSVMGWIDVRIRGPGSDPRAIASRTGTSSGPPRLCTVVTPLASMFQAFSAA